MPLIVFSFALLANSISITNVFPYGPSMCLQLELTEDRRKLGYYAGFLMSTYQLGQMVTSYCLGRLADTPSFGRKRVVLLGLASCTLPQIIFGMSPNFAFALSARFVMGLPNGIVLAAKALAPDLVPPHEQGLAMSLVAAMWGLGNVLGPALGGLLSETGPSDSILGTFPYLLPNLLCAVTAFFAMFAVHHLLPETRQGLAVSDEVMGSQPSVEAVGTRSSIELESSLAQQTPEPHVALEAPNKRPEIADSPHIPARPCFDSTSAKACAAEARTSSSSTAEQPEQERGTPAHVGVAESSGGGGARRPPAALVPPRALPPLLLYALLAGTAIMFDECLPLWSVAPKASGGLALGTAAIGGLLTVSGAALLLFQLILLPILTARMSYTYLFKASNAVCAVCYVLLPTVAKLPEAARWPLLLATIVLVRCVQGASFVTIFVTINNAVLARERGRVQGLAMAGAAAMRALGPVLGASLFAWSLTNGLGVLGLDVYFVFLLCSLASGLTACIAARHLPPDYNIECHKLQSRGCAPEGEAR